MLYGIDRAGADRLRFIGGGAQHGFTSRAFRSTRAIEVATEFAQFAGLPVGYRPGVALDVPIKDGGLGSSNRTQGIGLLSGALGALGVVEGASDGTGMASGAGREGVVRTGSASGLAATAGDMGGAGRIVATVVLGFRPSADDNAFTLLDGFEIEPGFSVREALRLILAASAGKVSGAAGTTITIRNPADTKNRIVATVDSSGNRTALTYDLTD